MMKENPLMPGDVWPRRSNRCFLVTTSAQKPPVRLLKPPIGRSWYRPPLCPQLFHFPSDRSVQPNPRPPSALLGPSAARRCWTPASSGGSPETALVGRFLFVRGPTLATLTERARGAWLSEGRKEGEGGPLYHLTSLRRRSRTTQSKPPRPCGPCDS